ncbi:MAG: putative DNA-binding domain-containing protein [Vicinamibacteria bacterium]
MRPAERGPLAACQALLLEELVALRREDAPPLGVLAQPHLGSLARRWHVYTSGYLARLVEALEADYPALRRILGPGAFGSLAARYLRENPPTSHDIGRCGAGLPEFMADDTLTGSLPFLPDLARLEWALAEAFVAADDRPFGIEDLAAAGPEAVADWPLALTRGTALLRSRWPLLELWRSRDLADDAVSIPLESAPRSLLVVREGFDVRPLEIGDRDARFLAGAAAGLRLADLADDVSSPEEADALALRFRSWTQAGVLKARRRDLPESPE